MKIVDNASMFGFGSNGSTIVECLDDHVGATQEAPEKLFYIYAPSMNLHIVQYATENGPIRAAIKWLVDDGF